MSSPKLSVVMSVYNNAPHVGQSIDSILRQSMGDFEFIIIDDGSQDGSSAIIDGFAARDQRIHLVHQEHRGTIAAANRGMAMVAAPLIARMDGDDFAHPDRFTRQIAFLDQHPDVGAIGTQVNVIDEAGAPRSGGADVPTEHDALVARLGDGTPILNPTAMLRTSVAQQVGGYRPAYRHCEDYEYWLRVAEVTRLANLPDRLLDYRFYGGQVSQKYIVAQMVGTAAAFAAYQRRAAGRPDPTADLTHLPDLDTLGRMFDDAAMSARVRQRILEKVDYNIPAFQHGATDMLIDGIARGEFANRGRALKIAARLIRAGQVANAARIAKAALFG